jgi:O-antigen/teichoic acid export membrane protein
VSLARGTGLRLASYGIGGLLSLLVLPLLVRHLGVEDFGAYVAVLSVVGIAALVSDLGISGIALREYTSAQAPDRQTLLNSFLGVRIGVSIAGIAAAIAFVFAAGYSDAAKWGTAVACLGLLAQVYADLAVVALLVESRFERAAAVDLTRSAGSSLLILVLVLADASLGWFFVAYAAAAAAAAYLAHRLAVEPMPIRPRMPTGGARTLLFDSIAYAVATAIYVVYFRAVMLVVSVQSTAQQTGYFASVFRLTEFVAAAAGIAASTATPALVRAHADGRFRRISRRLLLASAGIGGVVAAVVALAAPLIMRILGGDALDPAVPVLRVEAIAMGLVFPAFALGAGLLVLRRHAALIVTNSLGLATVLIASLILVPDDGARGGAVAAVIGEGVLVAAHATALALALRTEGLASRPSP